MLITVTELEAIMRVCDQHRIKTMELEVEVIPMSDTIEYRTLKITSWMANKKMTATNSDNYTDWNITPCFD